MKCVQITFKNNMKITFKTLPKWPIKICVIKLEIYGEKSCINLETFFEITFKKNIKITLKILPK